MSRKEKDMEILLGNLSISQIEKRLGITLTDEEIQFFNSTHQARAENIAKDKWHCFDIPFNMVCGSQDFAAKVYEILKPYSCMMNEILRISINKSES